MIGVDEGDRIAVGAPGLGFVSMGAALRCVTEVAPASIMVVDMGIGCVETSCCLLLRKECSSLIKYGK